MLFHFKDKFPQLNACWDKYLQFQKRVNLPAKARLLEEGTVSGNYIFIEKGCIRAALNHNGSNKTIQFFFEHEGLSSLESFLNDTPSLFTIETIEPSVIYLLPKLHFNYMIADLIREPDFVPVLLNIFAERQLHYMHEFVSFIKDTAEQRYQNLLDRRPYVIQRVPQHYIASYLGVTTVHLSRIKSKLAKNKPHF